jgi:hypothetical protein
VYQYNFQHGNIPALWQDNTLGATKAENEPERRRRGGRWASHGADVPYFFGNPPPPAWYAANQTTKNFTAPERALSEAFIAFLGRFVRSGDPNSNSTGFPKHLAPKEATSSEASESDVLPTWQEFPATLLLDINDPATGDTGLQVVPTFRQPQCDFWASQGL